MNEQPRFYVGYDGETTYEWRGQKWSCRHHSSGVQRAPDNRLVGCVYGDGSRNRAEFPPQELLQHFPGYVGAAYVPTGEMYQLGTTCGPITCNRCEWQFASEPRQEASAHGLVATAWREELDRYEAARVAVA